MQPSHRLPCCVEATAAYRPKALYALRMLLLPLGFDPVWVERASLGTRGLYYGNAPEGLAPSILTIRLAHQTETFFQEYAPYLASAVRWHVWRDESWPVLFDLAGSEDLVASAFFWLSGWQEHVIRRRDQHGRFMHRSSLQAELSTSARPVVDAYRERLADALQAYKIPSARRTWKGAAWALCPTVDIDYLRKWRKGMIYRETVEYLILGRQYVSLGKRLRRFGRFLADVLRPGDVFRSAFERMHGAIKRHGTATFFLKAAAHGPQDVAYDLKDPFLIQMVGKLEDDGFELGAHPSYHAHTHVAYLASETERIAALMQRAPVSVRQHFLRYESPATPRLQEKAGFAIDSTLGFCETYGFRNATCLPFQRFDIQKNSCSDVWEMPLAVMESALFNRCGLSQEEAIAASQEIIGACRRFGGVAVMSWHNVLWDELDHPGWGAHFTQTMEHAVARGAAVMSLREALSSWLGAPVEARISSLS